MRQAIYFMTGSSGSGKTTLLKTIAAHLPSDCAHFYFDDDGEFTMDDWFTTAVSSKTKLTVLDGSKRPTEVLATADKFGVSQLKIVLIDCNHEERKRRLVEEREQPELDKLDMYAWAAYLRGQADALELEVIDTTTASIAKSSGELLKSIQHFFSEVESFNNSA